MRIDHVCKKGMAFVVLAAFFLIGTLTGCASDGALSSSGTAEDAVVEESQDMSEKRSKRKRLTLDDGRRGKASPALKNPEMASPPVGPPSSSD